MSDCVELELLVIVLVIVEEVCVIKLSPVVLLLSDEIQEKVEFTFEVRAKFIPFPLQMVAVFTLVICGDGFTVVVTETEVPTQEPEDEVGVTV